MPQTPSRPGADRVERLLMIGSVLLITAGAFENLAATTILPVVARELDGFALYALAAGIPLATQVAAAAFGGVIVDAVGYLRPLVTGILLASAGLVLAGFAPEMWSFAVGRGLAGFGVGLLLVALYGAVGLAVRPERRSTFFAAFSAAWVVPSMVGPAVAGLLADAGLWRWVFHGTVPLFLGCLLVFLALPGDAAVAPEHRHRAAIRSRFMRVVPPAVVLAGALAVLQASAAEGADGGLATLPGVVISGAITLLITPLLLPAGTVRVQIGVPAAVATRLLVNATVIATEAYLPFYLQEVEGWTPTASGLVLTAGAVTWAVGSAVQTRLGENVNRVRVMVVGTLLLVVALVFILLLTTPHMPAAFVPIVWGIAGFGTGMTYPMFAVFALENTPVGKQGEVSAALQVADGMGSAVAIAMFGIAMTLSHGDFRAGFVVMLTLGVVAAWTSSRVRKPTPGTEESGVDLH